MDKFQLGYRGDIQGLRAVAILLVVASHAGVEWLAGGFVGVDVFFVLSGYLITGLLMQEIQATGRVQLLNFYARRLKRLLPAMLFMLLAVSLVATIFMAPIQQPYQAIASGYASVWLSNIFFALSDIDYFNPSAEQNLFRHTWSLGVEEQFYLAWPLLIVFLLGTYQWQGSGHNRPRLLWGLAAILGLSLLLSVYLSHTIAMWGFYLMPSRAWQFALGALALLLGRDHLSGSKSKIPDTPGFRTLVAIIGIVGIAFILFSAFYLNARFSYPGVWALLPSIGTALVLVAGDKSPYAGVSQILSAKPMQWIGNVSYSWYLWHWPVLLVGGAFLGTPGTASIWMLVALSLVIAFISYELVESPLRNNRWLSIRPKLTVAASLALMAAMGIASAYWYRNVILWIDSPEQKTYQQALVTDAPEIYSAGCDDWYSSSKLVACVFGAAGAKHTAVLVGDSVAAQWMPALAKIYNKPGWKLVVLTKSACPMVDEPFFYPRIGRIFTECAIWRDTALAWIKSSKPDVVFMGASRGEFAHDKWLSGTSRVLNRYANDVHKVYLVRPTYTLPFDGPPCLSRKKWLESFFHVGNMECSAKADAAEDAFLDWLTQAAQGIGNVSVLDMNLIVCPNGQCQAERGGKIVYRDHTHLSASYVKSIGDAMSLKIEAVVKPASK